MVVVDNCVLNVTQRFLVNLLLELLLLKLLLLELLLLLLLLLLRFRIDLLHKLLT